MHSPSLGHQAVASDHQRSRCRARARRALKGESCIARPRKDGSGYGLVLNEPYTGVMVFNTEPCT